MTQRSQPSPFFDHEAWLKAQEVCPYCQGKPPSSDGRTECGWC